MVTREEAENIAIEMAGLKKSEIVLMNRFSPKPFAEELMKKYSFKYDNFQRFWIYDEKEGLWIEDAEQFIKYILRQFLFGETQLKQNYTNEVVKHIQDLTWTREIPEDIDKNIVAFKNCLANIVTGEIMPFSKDYFITSKVNINLNKEIQTCPRIDDFFKSLLGDDKCILYDLITYCLYRGYPYQKMFILHGGGENGKTTFLDLLTHILGEQNISSETPQELSSPNSFSKGYLWKKFANISSELPYTALEDTNTIKGLCGGDRIKCNRKFKEPFQFKNFAKLIFAGNELPETNDKTHAFARRLYIIKFCKRIENPVQGFVNTLTNDEKELSGLAWICFQRLIKMRERGWGFEKEVNPEEMLKVYEELSNPIGKFMEEEIIQDPNGFVFKFQFKERFNAWTHSRGFRVWSEIEIARSLKENYTEAKKTFWKDGDAKRYNAWVGIKWKNGGDIE